MMLLDTHIFLWWLFDDARLPGNIRAYFRDINHTIYISAASVWEISTKFRLGRLPEASSAAKDVPYWIEKAGFQTLGITVEHAQLAGNWNVAHRDPFDCMLAAQARLEKMPLASLIDGKQAVIDGFLAENDLGNIRVGDPGRFYPESGDTAPTDGTHRRHPRKNRSGQHPATGKALSGIRLRRRYPGIRQRNERGVILSAPRRCRPVPESYRRRA